MDAKTIFGWLKVLGKYPVRGGALILVFADVATIGGSPMTITWLWLHSWIWWVGVTAIGFSVVAWLLQKAVRADGEMTLAKIKLDLAHIKSQQRQIRMAKLNAFVAHWANAAVPGVGRTEDMIAQEMHLQLAEILSDDPPQS